VRISFLMMAFGLTTSPVLVSLAVGLLTLTALYQVFRSGFKLRSLSWYECLPILLFLGNAIWYFFTNNHASMLTELRIKLPLLLIPFALHYIPRLSFKQILQTLQVFIIVLSAVLVATITNYLLHQETIDQLLLQSKAVPIITLSKHFSHIYFGVMASFTLLGAWYLFTIQHKWTRYVWLSFALFIFTGLHIISSRTGLVTAYGAIFIEGIRYMLVKKAYVRGLIVFFLIGFGAVIAIKTVPALKNKVVNTMDDFDHYRKQHNLADWSLTRRLIVLKLSTELIGRHPIVGVSPADSRDSLSNLYMKYHYDIPEEDRITDPHNQYLQYGVDIGLCGTFILLTIIFYPIIVLGKRIHPLLLALLIVSAIGMLFESLLERQFGVSFFMFFWSLFVVKPLPSD